MRAKRIMQDGFTLIELLIVIAVLGILAVVILVVMNPGERQAQARDTGRISAVAQIGRSIQAYYTVKSGYPETGTWAIDIVGSGDVSSFPSGIGYSYNGSQNCQTFVQPLTNPTFCYDEDEANGNGALVFSVAESTTYRSKCITPEEAYFVFSTEDSQGTICSNGDPLPWIAGSMTYVP